MDAEYRFIGSEQNSSAFTTFKQSLTLLATVISANHNTHVTVDAGLKALYFDPNTNPIVIHPENLRYEWAGFGDEHGKILSDNKLPTVNDVIEMITPHCDPTINLFDQFYVTENNIVIDIWPIDMRGKS